MVIGINKAVGKYFFLAFPKPFKLSYIYYHETLGLETTECCQRTKMGVGSFVFRALPHNCD